MPSAPSWVIRFYTDTILSLCNSEEFTRIWTLICRLGCFFCLFEILLSLHERLYYSSELLRGEGYLMSFDQLSRSPRQMGEAELSWQVLVCGAVIGVESRFSTSTLNVFVVVLDELLGFLKVSVMLWFVWSPRFLFNGSVTSESSDNALLSFPRISSFFASSSVSSNSLITFVYVSVVTSKAAFVQF